MITETRIFSQSVNKITLEETYQFILQSISKKQPALIFALNINILLLLEKEPAFKKKHRQAKIIFADGMPIVWLSKFSKRPLSARVSGTDLVEKILNNHNLKIFALGSTNKRLDKLKKKFPQSFVGSYAPSFTKIWSIRENNKIIDLICQSGAQVLLVGVGSLKQEKWLVQNFKQTNVYVGFGVGSALDILAGEKPRAPKWLQQLGLEWLWRLTLEPKRLLPRYLEDSKSLVSLILHWLRKKYFTC